jgi:glycosyltransferase involved in cell wall biosynthesis
VLPELRVSLWIEEVGLKLSVLIPVYNEEKTIARVVEAVLAAPLPSPMSLEIVVVDDASTDETPAVLNALAGEKVRVFRQNFNQGKGAAVRRALSEARGEVCIIQDADLEYDPRDFAIMLAPIVEKGADAVYGSRFIGSHRVFLYWHYLANKSLTWLTNVLYDTMLTDMETGYKAIRTDVMRALNLKSNTFDIEPEITAKLFKRRLKVFEVPITYSGRTYAEGKKIRFKDALFALWALVKFRFVD